MAKDGAWLSGISAIMTNGTGTDVNEISGKYGITASGLDNFVATTFKEAKRHSGDDSAPTRDARG